MLFKANQFSHTGWATKGLDDGRVLSICFHAED
jgi:hypothetical protein